MEAFQRFFTKGAAYLFLTLLALFSAVLLSAACSDRVTLSFETFGGTRIESICERAGETITPPSAPEREGYIFLGWCSDRDCAQPAELPSVMPEQSATFFAKFEPAPLLRLELCGGTLARTEYYLAAGTNLSEYLKETIPQKEGLEFGGWMLDGAPLSEEQGMPAEGATLYAQYLADYRVEVRRQNASGDGYDCEQIAAGKEPEGTVLTIEAPVYEHFSFDATCSSVQTQTLNAGGTLYCYSYIRESASLSYDPNAPQGVTVSGETPGVSSLYDAEETLAQSGFFAEGYYFLGWATSPEGEAVLPAGKTVRLEGNVVLYAAWAKLYADGRGSGELVALALAQREGIRQAVLLTADGALQDGIYEETSGLFTIGERRGRLTERGVVLFDDSGVYIGYSLAENRTDALFGTLTLSFADQTCRYDGNGQSVAGTYRCVFDETSGYYTDYYVFSGSEEFLFRLDRAEGSFLREGTEKGEYRCEASDGSAWGESLLLDGFGGAALLSGEEKTVGTYVGVGAAGEWEYLASDGTRYRFLTGAYERKIGGAVYARETVCLLYDEARAGSYASERGETLTLDGYGRKASYAAGEEKLDGPYAAEGPFVTLYAGEAELRLVLSAQSFSLCAEEAGYYEGEQGTLLLDGAGNALIAKEDGSKTMGTYHRKGDDWQCVFADGTFEFRLAEGRYLLYDEALSGVFETMGGGLTLDGYGNGIYLTVTEGSVQVKAFAPSENAIELYSDAFDTPKHSLLFSVDRVGRTMTRVRAEEAGVYAIEGDLGKMLYLDGSGGALLLDGRAARGTYTFDALAGEGMFAPDAAFAAEYSCFRFRLSYEQSLCVVCLETVRGEYGSAAGETLSLDGYGGGSYVSETGETVSGEAVLYGDTALLFCGDLLRLFLLSGREILSVSGYSYLGTAQSGEGTWSLYVDEQKTRGCLVGADFFCMTDALISEGTIVLTAENLSLRLRAEGSRLLIYDERLAGEYSAEGMSVRLDGYGRGEIVRGESVSVCSAAWKEGYFELVCDNGERLCFAVVQGTVYTGETETVFVPVA